MKEEKSTPIVDPEVPTEEEIAQIRQNLRKLGLKDAVAKGCADIGRKARIKKMIG